MPPHNEIFVQLGFMELIHRFLDDAGCVAALQRLASRHSTAKQVERTHIFCCPGGRSPHLPYLLRFQAGLCKAMTAME